jgi:hypothetical protein
LRPRRFSISKLASNDSLAWQNQIDFPLQRQIECLAQILFGVRFVGNLVASSGVLKYLSTQRRQSTMFIYESGKGDI